MGVEIAVTVFLDAVKLECIEGKQRKIIGWFMDEVSAVGAAMEHMLMHSAVLPQRRRLPEFVVSCDYRKSKVRRPVTKFRRATAVKIHPERHVVMTPGANGKPWL